MHTLDAYRAVRAQTLALAAPLSAEDQQVQSMPDASPTKWHLAHSSWFFETFVLEPRGRAYRPFDPTYRFLFNSYYEALGARLPRARRGLLSRPSLADVHAYRRHVDDAMARLLEPGVGDPALAATIELGLHHEQQHQELILTDIKHVLGTNPLRPPYHAPPDGDAGAAAARAAIAPAAFRLFAEGLARIGHDGPSFAFDNEGPRHRVFLRAFAIADRPVTCGEYLAFMRDGGYARAELWLSEGWQLAQQEQWRAPLYWDEMDGVWMSYTLHGLLAVDARQPVAHVSYFEADAYARWAGARLPTEQEWERAATDGDSTSDPAPPDPAGHFAGSGRFHTGPARAGFFGDVWQWTGSPYAAYPGYRAPAGAVGEYNGKFMCNQMVLRGGSCLTPAGHVRATYRNFFPPAARWQASGIRLARDA